MDPLATAIQLLQESHDIIAILLDALSNKSKPAKEQNKGEEVEKHASEEDLGLAFGINPDRLPEFAKYASMEDARILRNLIEQDLSYGSLGKLASVSSEDDIPDDPNKALNARLASIIHNM